jgi:hypothetical protein
LPVNVSKKLGYTTNPPGSAELEKVAEIPFAVSVKLVDVPRVSLSKLNWVVALAAEHRQADASANVRSLNLVEIMF